MNLTNDMEANLVSLDQEFGDEEFVSQEISDKIWGGFAATTICNRVSKLVEVKAVKRIAPGKFKITDKGRTALSEIYKSDKPPVTGKSGNGTYEPLKLTAAMREKYGNDTEFLNDMLKDPNVCKAIDGFWVNKFYEAISK